MAFNIGLFLEPLELLSMNNTLSLESVLKPVTVFLNVGEIILPLGISEYLPKTNLPITYIILIIRRYAFFRFEKAVIGAATLFIGV